MHRVLAGLAVLLGMLVLGTATASAAAPPTLTTPADGLRTNGPSLTVTYTLPQTSSGLPTLTMAPTGGGLPRTFSLTADAAGEHTLALGLADPTASTGVSSGSSTDPIADGTYGVQVSDGATSSPVATITIDRFTTTPQLIAPAANAAIDGPSLVVSYVLPEAAQSGSVKVTLTPTANGLPRTLTLSSAAAGAAAISIDRAFPADSPGVAAAVPSTAISDGTYDVMLSYGDALGNPAATATATGVVLRTAAPRSAAIAAKDTIAPRLTAARVLAKSFKPARPPKVRFRLSEAARMSFLLERRRRGAWVRVASSTRPAPAGPAFIRLPRGLFVGPHRLTIRATDAAGNRSVPVRLSFLVR